MARVPDTLTELMGSDSLSDHHEVDCHYQMEHSFYDSSPCPFPKNCSVTELESNWKVIDKGDSLAFRGATELPHKETRKAMKSLPRSFTDIHLKRMLDSAPLEDPVSTNSTFKYTEPFTYKYTRSKQYTVRDVEHKSLVLQRHHGQAQLVAKYLSGPSSSDEVKLNLDLYRSQQDKSPKHTNPVAVNVVESKSGENKPRENNLYLCCAKAGGLPMLQLEKVKGPIKVIKSGDLDCFLFFNNNFGSTFNFESAAYPGWFISTSKLNERLVRIVNQIGERDITDFQMTEV